MHALNSVVTDNIYCIFQWCKLYCDKTYKIYNSMKIYAKFITGMNYTLSHTFVQTLWAKDKNVQILSIQFASV